MRGRRPTADGYATASANRKSDASEFKYRRVSERTDWLRVDALRSVTDQLADPLGWCLLDLLHARAADELRVAGTGQPVGGREHHLYVVRCLRVGQPERTPLI